MTQSRSPAVPQSRSASRPSTSRANIDRVTRLGGGIAVQDRLAFADERFADLAVLSADYFSVDAEEIKAIESMLTIMDGEIVFAQGPFSEITPPRSR